MNIDDVATLYRYHSWAWGRVLANTGRVTDDQYGALAPVPHGSLRGTLVHALAAETMWLRRWQGDSPTVLLQEIEVPTFEGLSERWAAEEKAQQDFIAGLNDADLTAKIDYKTTQGTPHTDVLWHLLVHVVNHGTQHRAEAAMLLTTYGRSPGDLDLTTFLRLGR